MSQERAVYAQGKESLWKSYTELLKKSNAVKIGTGMTAVGVIFGLGGIALLGLGAIAGSGAWHSEKNPFKGREK